MTLQLEYRKARKRDATHTVPCVCCDCVQCVRRGRCRDGPVLQTDITLWWCGHTVLGTYNIVKYPAQP